MEFIKIIPVFFYAEESGREPVRIWLQEFSGEDRKIIGRNIREVQMDWPVGSPLVKSLGNGLWEIRSSLHTRISRVLFVFHNGSIILLHGFIKKTQATPQHDIELARKRAKKL